MDIKKAIRKWLGVDMIDIEAIETKYKRIADLLDAKDHASRDLLSGNMRELQEKMWALEDALGIQLSYSFADKKVRVIRKEGEHFDNAKAFVEKVNAAEEAISTYNAMMKRHLSIMSDMAKIMAKLRSGDIKIKD